MRFDHDKFVPAAAHGQRFSQGIGSAAHLQLRHPSGHRDGFVCAGEELLDRQDTRLSKADSERGFAGGTLSVDLSLLATLGWSRPEYWYSGG